MHSHGALLTLSRAPPHAKPHELPCGPAPGAHLLPQLTPTEPSPRPAPCTQLPLPRVHVDSPAPGATRRVPLTDPTPTHPFPPSNPFLRPTCVLTPGHVDSPAPGAGLLPVGDARLVPVAATLVDLPWHPGHKAALCEFTSPFREFMCSLLVVSCTGVRCCSSSCCR